MIGKALIVDDDELILNFLNTLLTKKFGIRVVTAKDGLEGVDQMNRGGVDIVFLDIMMPRLDGIGFLEKIKEDIRYAHVPIVVVSAVNQKETIARLIQLGVKDYILKPLEFMKIVEKMNELLVRYD